jgi:lipopolysaccharide transport system permease protein
MMPASATIESFKALSHSRGLLWSWTLRTIRARYQQSVLGWLWAIAQPAAQVAIFTLVFTQFVRVDTGGIPYVLFSYVALAPWAFFSTSLTDMCSAIVDNLRLVTRIYFPREVLPISAMLARLMDFGVASLLIIVFAAYYQLPIRPEHLLLLPIVLSVQIALTLGVGLAFAATNVFLRDMRPLLALMLQLWFYLSPIIYPVTAVPERFRDLYVLNPLVGIVEAHRAIWLNQPFPVSSLVSAGIVSLVSLVAGYVMFKKSEAVFSDIG